MTYKNKLVGEVKHYLITGNIEFLDKFVTEKLQEGWTYADSKIVHFDLYDGTFQVFYIFTKNSE